MALNVWALSNLARTKSFMGISIATNDTLIENLINSATDFIERYCGVRRFKETSYRDEVYDGTGTNKLNLRNWPVNISAVFNLYERDSLANIDSWTLMDDENYFIQYNEGQLDFISNKFTAYPRHWKINYTAGYNYDNATTFLSDVGMSDLEHALWVLVNDLYRLKSAPLGVESESIGNYSISYGGFTKAMDLHPDVKEYISTLRRPQAY
jgi:hypothetical protein